MELPVSIKTPRLIRDRCGVFYFHLIVPLDCGLCITMLNHEASEYARKIGTWFESESLWAGNDRGICLGAERIGWRV